MLQKQTITIPLGLGVNTKTDEKLVEAGQFNLVCENATFEKVGAVSKRDSYEALSTSYYDSTLASGSAAGDYTLLSNPPTMGAALGKSLLLRNSIGSYLYLHEGNFVYNNAYPIPEAKVTSLAVYPGKTTVDHTDCDYDADENIIIAVARDGNQGGSTTASEDNASTLILHDLTTETTVSTEPIANTSNTPTFGYVRCGYTRVSSQSYYYNVVTDSDLNLKIKIFNKYGQVNSTSHTIANILSSGPTNKGPLGVCRSTDNTSFYIIVATTTANLGKFIAISGTTKTYETTFAFTGATGMTSATAKYSGGLIYFAYNGTNQIVFNPDGTIAVADAALSGLSMGGGIAYDQDSTSVIFGRPSGALLHSWTGGVSTLQNDNTKLMTDKITLGGIPFYVGAFQGNSSYLSATYFALPYVSLGRSGQQVFARMARDTALRSTNISPFDELPSRIAKISSTKCAVALPVFRTINGTAIAYGMNLFFIEILQDYKSNSRATLGKNIHLAGGFMAEFDGIKMFENGFHADPVSPVIDVTAAGSLTGTFSYIYVLKYIDKNGQVTRSAPSLASSTGAIVSKEAALSIVTSPFGVKPLSCIVEIYRTTDGGSTYYQVTEIPANMYDGASIALYTDNTADASLTLNRILYTSGDILQNDPAPSCKFVFQGGNRVFAGGLDDENEIAYSKKKLFDECVNFSDLFRIRFDSSQFNIAGGCTAGGFMDGKIIIFKRNSIFYVAGDGPLETGLDNTYTDPELVTAATGCTDPRSVVLTPMGLMFKGDKGIYLLSRGLETQYIGSGVEEFNEYQVTSAVHLDKKNQVVFTVIKPDVSLKAMLVFDYFTQQWSVTRMLRAIDSDVLDGDHVILNSTTSTPMVQTGTDFLDVNQEYALKVKTPWIKLSGLQDFGRIWSATVLGKFKAAHNLIVKARYDYDESYVETFTITPLIADVQYQYRCHLRKQKCEAIQFEIYDSAIVGESMELTAITLEVGLKKGSMKLPAARKY